MTIPEFPSDIFGLGMYVITPFVLYYIYKNRHRIDREDDPNYRLGQYSQRLVYIIISVFIIGSVLGIILFYGNKKASHLAWNLGMWIYLISFLIAGVFIQYKFWRKKKDHQNRQPTPE